MGVAVVLRSTLTPSGLERCSECSGEEVILALSPDDVEWDGPPDDP